MRSDTCGCNSPAVCSFSCSPPFVLQRHVCYLGRPRATAKPKWRLRLHANTVRASATTPATACRIRALAPAPYAIAHTLRTLWPTTVYASAHCRRALGTTAYSIRSPWDASASLLAGATAAAAHTRRRLGGKAETARGRCCRPRCSPALPLVPAICEPQGSGVCHAPLASPNSRTNFLPPEPSRGHRAGLGAMVGSRLGHAWLHVVAPLSRACCWRASCRHMHMRRVWGGVDRSGGVGSRCVWWMGRCVMEGHGTGPGRQCRGLRGG